MRRRMFRRGFGTVRATGAVRGPARATAAERPPETTRIKLVKELKKELQE